MSDFRFDSIGNMGLLDLPKVGFLASKNYDGESAAKTREWARAIGRQGKCVVSGFQSKLECDVFEILLKGECPIIMVLGRGIYDEVPDRLQRHINSGRLLIISPFSQGINAATRDLAFVRNRLVADLCAEIVVGSLSPGGMLESVLLDAGKVFKKL